MKQDIPGPLRDWRAGIFDWKLEAAALRLGGPASDDFPADLITQHHLGVSGRHSDWSIWDKPIKEFMHWFELLESNDEIKFKDIDPLPEFQFGGLANDVNNSQRENDDWNGNIWGLAEELADKVIDKDGKGEFKTKKDAWRWGAKNMTCNGEKVTVDSLGNEYYKASSRGDIELEKEISDEERLDKFLSRKK